MNWWKPARLCEACDDKQPEYAEQADDLGSRPQAGPIREVKSHISQPKELRCAPQARLGKPARMPGKSRGLRLSRSLRPCWSRARFRAMPKQM